MSESEELASCEPSFDALLFFLHLEDDFLPFDLLEVLFREGDLSRVDFLLFALFLEGDRSLEDLALFADDFLLEDFSGDDFLLLLEGVSLDEDLLRDVFLPEDDLLRDFR